MATTLYWFSGSGNTLAAAKMLAEKIDGAVLQPVIGSGPARPSDGDTVGFVFPVYSWGPPRLVARFIKSCDLRNDSYVFAVYTCGGGAGSTARITSGMVKKAGGKLRAAYGITMVENYPPFGGAPGKEKQEQVLGKTAGEIDRIARSLAERPDGYTDPSSFKFRVIGSLVYPLFNFGLKYTSGSFKSDDKCNGCGICEKICPVENIKITDGKPVWDKRCEQCYACFHWCPEKAVQYGKKSAGQVRYHHPDVSLNEMLVRKTN